MAGSIKNVTFLGFISKNIICQVTGSQQCDPVTWQVVRFILDKSEGTIGEIITLLTKAAIIAIESGEEVINKKVLAHIDYLSPTERRRISERDLIQ